ncbi:MAG: flagellar biosynthesis anti-sigma factor FlgM [Spirochaetota bacterium]|nr:flagellar biosynthesis anti-sigma factor FlgM [Spirochaetota bacterium]
MVIEKIGNINNIIETKGTKSVSKSKELKKSDSIQISSEGKKAAEISQYTKIVNEAPDIRSEKVNEIKQQIKEGKYDKFNDNKVLQMVADKIAENLLRK